MPQSFDPMTLAVGLAVLFALAVLLLLWLGSLADDKAAAIEDQVAQGFMGSARNAR